MRLVALCLACVTLACASSKEAPSPPPTTIPDVAPTPVRASFELTIDGRHPDLDRKTLEPVATPVSIVGDGSTLSLTARVRKIPQRAGVLEAEIFVENRTPNALRDASITIESTNASAVHPLDVDPLADASSLRTFRLGGIAHEGVARHRLGFSSEAKLSIKLVVSAIATSRKATSSAPLAITPDGNEVWAPFADADVVTVVDTRTDTRVAQLSIAGRPSSIAITPDGALVLIASARANTLTVVDRVRRSVVQTFGEADGIGREPRHVVTSPDGGRAFVSAYVGDSITALVRNGDRYRIERSVTVGRRPTGLSVSPDSSTLLVAHFLPRGTVTSNEGWITALATDPLAIVREVAIHDHFNLEPAQCFAEIFGVKRERLTTEGVSSQLAGVFLDPSGSVGWTPGTRIAGATVAWERGPKSKPLSSFASIRTGELAAPFLFLFDARTPRAIDRMPLASVVDPPDANLAFARCARIQAEIEMISRDEIPSQPGRQVNRAAAFPSPITGLSETGIARFIGFTRGGRRALVLSHMADEIAVVDAITQHPITQRHAQLAGHNPIGLVLTPDGSKAYVAYESSTHLSVLDASAYADPRTQPPSWVPYAFEDVKEFPSNGGGITRKRLVRNVSDVPDRPALPEIARVVLVDADPLPKAHRRGKILFSSSNPEKFPTLTKSRLGACASCHPDGGSDGTSWGTMEGERRTMSLRGGVAGRGWLHASGTHQDIEEFATVIVKERLGGELAPADVHALAEWVAHGIPSLQAPHTDAALGARGALVFGDKCASCHAGSKLTSGAPDPASPFGGGVAAGPTLYDVKTATDDAHVILGSFFESLLPKDDAEVFRLLRGDRALGPSDPVQAMLDFRPRPERRRGALKAPSLVGIWDHAVFFHDGRFDRLEDAVHFMNDGLRLGIGVDDERAIVEWLRTQ